MICDLDLLRVYGSHETEGRGQRSRLGIGLGSQFETRSVRPRSLNEDSFLVLNRDHVGYAYVVLVQNCTARVIYFIKNLDTRPNLGLHRRGLYAIGDYTGPHVSQNTQYISIKCIGYL